MPCLVQGKKRSTNLLKPTSDKSLSHSRCPQVLSGANMSQCQLARPKAQCHNGRHAAEDEAQDHGDSQVYVPRSKTKAVLAGLHRKDRGRQNQESKLQSNCLRTFAFFIAIHRPTSNMLDHSSHPLCLIFRLCHFFGFLWEHQLRWGGNHMQSNDFSFIHFILQF